MLIALDIGNTNIKSALFAGNQIMDFTAHSNTNKAIEYIKKTTFSEAAICSVNPTSQKIVNDIISAKHVSTFEANVKNKFNLTIKYETPETLGMDRVCSTVGAFGTATNEKIISDNSFLITIDFGTATTINVVTPGRQFIGGLIIPGINTMLNSLNKKTAQLPLPDLQSYRGVIGNSTNSSIISGVITATIGSINETVNKIREDSKQDPVIFVTGGNAKFILPHIKNKVIFDEGLVLKGLKLIYNMNK